MSDWIDKALDRYEAALADASTPFVTLDSIVHTPESPREECRMADTATAITVEHEIPQTPAGDSLRKLIAALDATGGGSHNPVLLRMSEGLVTLQPDGSIDLRMTSTED